MYKKILTGTPICVGDSHTLDMVSTFKNYLPSDFEKGIFLHCGDCGEGFSHPIKEKHLITKLYDYLKSIDSYLIICRGNHSNPVFFSDDHWANKEFGDRVYFAPDYSIFNIEDKKVQIVGGAISIDRSERIIGKSWWTNEEVRFAPEQVEEVDILITHTAPTDSGIEKASANNMVTHYHSVDFREGGNLLNELEEEARIVQNISDLSGCRSHFFGHMHQNSFYFDKEKSRKYIGVGIDEFRAVV